MFIERLVYGTEYRLVLSIKQLSAIERGLYKLTKHTNDPESYSLQFELKEYLRKELEEIKRHEAALKEREAQPDKIGLRYGEPNAQN